MLISPKVGDLCGLSNWLVSLAFFLLVHLEQTVRCEQRTTVSATWLQHTLQLQPLARPRFPPVRQENMEIGKYKARKPVMYKPPTDMKSELRRPLNGRESEPRSYRRPVIYGAPRHESHSTQIPVKYLPRKPVVYNASWFPGKTITERTTLYFPTERTSTRNSSMENEYLPMNFGFLKELPARGSAGGFREQTGNQGTLVRDHAGRKVSPDDWKFSGSLRGGDSRRLRRSRHLAGRSEETQQSPHNKQWNKIDITSPSPFTDKNEGRRKFLYTRRKKLTLKIKEKLKLIHSERGFVIDYTKRKKKVREKCESETNATRKNIMIISGPHSKKFSSHESENITSDLPNNFDNNGRKEDDIKNSSWNQDSVALGQHTHLTPAASAIVARNKFVSTRLNLLARSSNFPDDARGFQEMIEHELPLRVVPKWHARMKRSWKIKSSTPTRDLYKENEGGSLSRNGGRYLQYFSPVETYLDTTHTSAHTEKKDNTHVGVVLHKILQISHIWQRGLQRLQSSSYPLPCEVKVKEDLNPEPDILYRPVRRRLLARDVSKCLLYQPTRRQLSWDSTKHLQYRLTRRLLSLLYRPVRSYLVALDSFRLPMKSQFLFLNSSKQPMRRQLLTFYSSKRSMRRKLLSWDSSTQFVPRSLGRGQRKIKLHDSEVDGSLAVNENTNGKPVLRSIVEQAKMRLSKTKTCNISIGLKKSLQASTKCKIENPDSISARKNFELSDDKSDTTNTYTNRASCNLSTILCWTRESNNIYSEEIVRIKTLIFNTEKESDSLTQESENYIYSAPVHSLCFNRLHLTKNDRLCLILTLRVPGSQRVIKMSLMRFDKCVRCTFTSECQALGTVFNGGSSRGDGGGGGNCWYCIQVQPPSGNTSWYTNSRQKQTFPGKRHLRCHIWLGIRPSGLVTRYTRIITHPGATPRPLTTVMGRLPHHLMLLCTVKIDNTKVNDLPRTRTMLIKFSVPLMAQVQLSDLRRAKIQFLRIKNGTDPVLGTTNL
nr:uncharacterized protein LOC128703608 [Cherax quadricarinatus]